MLPGLRSTPARLALAWLAGLSMVALAACGGGSGTGSNSGANSSPTRSAVSSSPAGRSTGAASNPSSPAPAGPLTQRTETPMPVPIEETAAAVSNGHLYVLGGYNAAGISQSSDYVFDGTRWSTGPALPQALNHPAATSLGDAIYLAGGFTGTGAATNRAFVLAPGGSAWQEIAPLRRARGAMSLLAVGGKLYAIGGNSGSVQVAVPESYDPATKVWTDLPAMPQPRNHLAGFVVGTRACVAGGRIPTTSVAVNCFDPVGSTWSTEASLPTGTTGAAGGLVPASGVAVVAGGEPFPETALVPLVQELRGGTWSSVPMVVPRHGMGSAIYQGRLWMCGGATAPGVHAVPTCTSIG